MPTGVPRSNVETTDYEPFYAEGEPYGEVHWLRQDSETDPNGVWTGMWRSQPATVNYTFTKNETFHLLEGEMRIELDSGDVVELKPGDIVSFRKGTGSRSTVKTAVRKFFVMSG